MKLSVEIPERYKYCCSHTDNEIKGFFGPWRIFSNFHLCDVEYGGLIFPSAEHAYVFAKLETPTADDYSIITGLTAAGVKAYGRSISLRPDWEDVKYRVMHLIVKDKFTRHEDLKQALISTGTKYIEETNSWGDTYWGVDIKKGGQNNLGKIIMAVRESVTLRDLFE